MTAQRGRPGPRHAAGQQQQLPLTVSIVKSDLARVRKSTDISRQRISTARPDRPVSEVLSVMPMDQILSTEDVEQITGRHRSTVFRWMSKGRFPRKVVHEGFAVGWRRSDVERWLRGNPVATGLKDSRLP